MQNAAKNFVTVIDYGAGNIRSVARALEWVIATSGLNLDVRVTNKAKDIKNATRIVLPGQGSFGACMDALTATPDMLDTLEERVARFGVPFLGICVGMQLMADRGLEHGIHKGLGWIPGEVVPLRGLIAKAQIVVPHKTMAIVGGYEHAMEEAPLPPRIPHMGWNEIRTTHHGADHPLMRGVESGEHFYFVHSFVMQCKNEDHVLARTEHGAPFACAVARDNMAGIQFHPEKSQRAGLTLLTNFMRWRP